MTDEQPIKIEDLKVFEIGEPIDIKKYEGKISKIDKVEVIDTFTSYNDEGKWVEGLKRPTKSLKVSSEVLEIINRTQGEPIELRASMLFNLKEHFTPEGVKIWGVSKSPNSKLYQFIRKMKVDTIKELENKQIVITSRTSKNPDDDREWLGFAL